MKVDGGRGKLYDAHQVIRRQWDEVRDFWSDSVRAEFEEGIWNPLDQLAGDGLRAIDRLARVLNECRRECSGQR